MTVNQKIIESLTPLGFPVVPDLYTGAEEVYMTFNYSVRGDLFADNAPGFDIYLVQIHLFAPYGWDSVETRKEIKRRLFAAGFTWPAEEDAGNERKTDDAKGQHIVFEC